MPISTKTRGKVPSPGEAFLGKAYSGRPGVFEVSTITPEGKVVPYNPLTKTAAKWSISGIPGRERTFYDVGKQQLYKPGTTQEFEPIGAFTETLPQYNVADVGAFFQEAEWYEMRGLPYPGQQRYTAQQLAGEVPTFGEVKGQPEATTEGFGPSSYTGPSILPEAEGAGITTDEERRRIDQERVDREKAQLEAFEEGEKKIALLGQRKTTEDLETALGIIEPPVPPSFAEDYQVLLEEQGIDAIQTQLNDINTQIANAESAIREEEGRLAPTELIKTRQSEIGKSIQDLNSRKRVLQEQMNMKLGIVNNIMSLSQLDYSIAQDQYNTSFNQSIKLHNLLTDERDFTRDSASANLSIISNLASQYGWNPDLIASATSEATKLGINLNMVEAFMNAKPKAKLLTSVVFTDEQGRKGTQFIWEDPLTGRPGINEVVYSPGVDGGNKAIKDMSAQLDMVKGDDGYVSPDSWKMAKNAWVSEGLPPEDFIKQFYIYINPNEPIIKGEEITGVEKYGSRESKYVSEF